MAELSGYSALDRLMHRIAFLSPSVQMTAADLEDTLFGSAYAATPAADPVMVTSLPRAGTTILLTALNAVPELSTHLYRDMPFVMAPILWSRLNAPFRKRATLQERAHGDGIEIGYDSPEAFEEVIWRAFWPEKYHAGRIDLWDADDAKEEARAFLVRHFRKIVALRQGADATGGRYLSKNNGNVARIELILSMFPAARIVVPVRRPAAHAASLHRQHLNFRERHRSDAFAERYMGDIGHYEFGALHRPIAFEGFADLARGLGPDRLDYWVAYWIAGFEHIRRFRDRVLILGYEAMCRDGGAAGALLADFLGLDPVRAEAIGGHFRPAGAPPELSGVRRDLVEQAEALHADLTGGTGVRG